MSGSPLSLLIFFLSDPPTTDIYTLSLHDALPISTRCLRNGAPSARARCADTFSAWRRRAPPWRPPSRSPTPGNRPRSEEHTSELQSRGHLVCRLLLEKKKTKKKLEGYTSRFNSQA